MGRLIVNLRASRRSAPSLIDLPLSLAGFGAKLTPASANCNANFNVFCPSTRSCPFVYRSHILWLSPPAASTVTPMDTREHRRVRMRLPVRLRWTTPFAQKIEFGESIDVSRGGLLV